MATFTRRCGIQMARPIEWMVIIGNDASRVGYVESRTFPSEEQVRRELRLRQDEVFLVGRQ